MCNATTYSESGAPITPTRCADFLLLQSDRDRLAGVVQGMEDQNARNVEALRRAEDANAELRRGKAELHAMWVKQVEENARLREALKFYANPKKHRLKGEWQHGYPGGVEYQDGKHSMLDTGQIASNALKEVG